VVVDTSALVAVLFNEDTTPWVANQLELNRAEIMMSAVNFAEVLVLIGDRQPHLAPEIRAAIEATGIRIVPSTLAHAELAAAARLKYPLNFGDCFAYALAKHEDLPLLTLDRDFRKTDITVVTPRRSN